MVAIPTQGKGDWVDYTDYWREADAEWLMKRTVLRYASATARTADWPTPEVGMLTYNIATTAMEYYTTGKWIPVTAASNLWALPAVSTSASQSVTIGHRSGDGGGITFNAIGTLSGQISVDRQFVFTAIPHFRAASENPYLAFDTMGGVRMGYIQYDSGVGFKYVPETGTGTGHAHADIAGTATSGSRSATVAGTALTPRQRNRLLLRLPSTGYADDNYLSGSRFRPISPRSMRRS